MRRLVAAIVVCGAIVGAHGAGDPAAWVYFDSAETGSGPRLAVTWDDGTSEEIAAAADTLVISYLNEFVGAAHARLSLSLNDSNRVLLRFDVPPGKAVKKAELVLQMRLPDQLAVSEPFEMAVHAIAADWEPGGVTWRRQPTYVREPLRKVRVVPKPAEIRIVVTEDLVAKSTEASARAHGWMLRIARPLPEKDDPGSTPAPQTGPPSVQAPPAIASFLDWAPDVRTALSRAAKMKCNVLAVVDGTNQPNQPTEGAALVHSILLTDPDVRALVERRFVPVVVGYFAQTYTTGGDDGCLRALGTTVPKAKAPALVVADAKGKHLATLQSIGTFDGEAVFRFLAATLPPVKGESDVHELIAMGDLAGAEAGCSKLSGADGALARARIAMLRGEHEAAVALARPHAIAEGATGTTAKSLLGVALCRLGRLAEAEAPLAAAAEAGDARALYHLGALRYRDGRVEEARASWQHILDSAKDDPWVEPARHRLAKPEAYAMYVPIEAVSLPKDAKGTEVVVADKDVARAVARGIDHLLAQQRPDGSWPVGDPLQEMYRTAVTAIAARALLDWQDGGDAARRERVARSIDRARAWLDQRMASEAAEQANSFGAAYVLDFQLARAAADPGAKADAEKAAAYLVGGQCPNGAWSYDRGFGVRWTGGFGGWPKTDKGRVHSMNTGLSLRALGFARDAGVAVDAQSLERGTEALLRMKVGPAAFTYTWPEPINWEKLETSMGRAPLCEMALQLGGKGRKADLERALAYFMEHRSELRDAVKLSAGWTMPAGVSDYFYFFAYLHAAEAIDLAGGASRATRLKALRDDLLGAVEADGTWVDWPAAGKSYGTAMALRVLRICGR